MTRSMTRRALPALGMLLALAACSDHNPVGPGARSAEGLAPGASHVPYTGKIRIGVVQDASSVVVGAPTSYTITNRTTGAVLLTGSGDATVTVENVSVVDVKIRLQVVCGTPAAVNALKAQAEALGHVTFTEVIPACTRLYLGAFAPPPANTFAARTAYRNLVISQGLAGTDSFYRTLTTTTGVTQYRIQRGGDVATSTGPVMLSADGGIVTIAGQPYRGIAEVRVNGSGIRLAGINELPMEDYLYGVVPRELPPVPYDELEALKAQAVAARTYALVGLGKRAAEGYDLNATTSDQVYGGYAAEHPLSTQAVDATAGMAAVYNGTLIEALYHSTSGGYTANSEDVYNSAPVPYLRGVIDHQHGNSEHVLDSLKRHPNPTSLRGRKNGDWEGDWSRYHRWTFEWSMDEISEVIGLYAQQPVGKVLAINVTDRSGSGRVRTIEYVTEAGVFTDTKDHVRTSLKYIGANGTPASLLSTLFVIEPVLAHTPGEVEGYVAFGGGWGHGVGLSQTGAVGMAEKGATYEEILHHYYQGISLVKWY
ncbi:MAG TPA: SpoIID/LytB domain-containing protein [Longimicrobium sp.]|nr:SpoIID/LytB domain-containing protein [Longimicrobium sp.]